MKAVHVLVAVIALVVGIAVGGLGPRAEVRALRAQLEEAGECSTSGVGGEIANVFRGRPWEEQTGGRKVTRVQPDGSWPSDAGPPPDPNAPAVQAAPAPADPEAFEEQWEDENREELSSEKGLSMAREAMELRYAQARAALLEDAAPSDTQLAAFDQAVDGMNDELVGLARELAGQMQEGGEPSRRDTMLYAAETLDVLLSAEERLRSTLTEEQIANLQEESLDPMSYVDPAILDVLGEIDR